MVADEKVSPWALLTARWPTIFDLDNPRPLKIGIHKDIAEVGMDPALVKIALGAYVSKYPYRHTLLAGAVRIDLDGQAAGEVLERGVWPWTRKPPKTPKHPPVSGSVPLTLPKDLPLTGENLVPGKLEVTIKFNALPKPLTLQSGFKFGIDADGKLISITVKPKVWKKLTDAAAQWPSWVATLTGKMGQTMKDGFELLDPAVQVFEKKGKEGNVAERPAASQEETAQAVSAVEQKPMDAKSEPVASTRDGKGVIVTVKARRKLTDGIAK